jgi:hypothetical protein
MSDKKTYCIKKHRTIKASDSDRTFIQTTLMVNTLSEVQEYSDLEIVTKVCAMLNANTDSNCTYEVV